MSTVIPSSESSPLKVPRLSLPSKFPAVLRGLDSTCANTHMESAITLDSKYLLSCLDRCGYPTDLWIFLRLSIAVEGIYLNRPCNF